MTDQRTRISQAISPVPGIHFDAIVRRLDLAPGRVQHHIRKLLRDDVVVEERRYGRTHYYPPGYTDFQRGAIALFHRETARDILLYLPDNGPSAPTTVAASLDIARSTLEWQLDRLVDGTSSTNDGTTMTASR